MAHDYSFSLAYDAFDVELIGLKPEDIGGPEFLEKVPRFFVRQFSGFGAKARVVLNDRDRIISVEWQKERSYRDPKARAIELLDDGRASDALPILWTLHQNSPDDSNVVFLLANAQDELGRVAKAIALYRQLLAQVPGHVNGRLRLGVALTRTDSLDEAESHLREAVRLQPQNAQAKSALATCLSKQGRTEESVPFFEDAVKALPGDARTLIGLATAYEALERIGDADDIYLRTIRAGGPADFIETAKERRTAIASRKLRANGSFRADVALYIAGALGRFETMTPREVLALGVEIATVGMNGLDINDPTPKYAIKSLPGKFSGLHLLSIMYAAFKREAPQQDVGIDFSEEYREAVASRGKAG